MPVKLLFVGFWQQFFYVHHFLFIYFLAHPFHQIIRFDTNSLQVYASTNIFPLVPVCFLNSSYIAMIFSGGTSY